MLSTFPMEHNSNHHICEAGTGRDERLAQGHTDLRGEPGFGPRQPDSGAQILKSDDVLYIRGPPRVMGAEYLGRCSRLCTGRQEKTSELIFLFIIYCFPMSVFYFKCS